MLLEVGKEIMGIVSIHLNEISTHTLSINKRNTPLIKKIIISLI